MGMMNEEIMAFRLSGIPVLISRGFLSIISLILFVAVVSTNIYFIILVISYFLLLLLHELGHAYYARRLRYVVDSIRLRPMVGYCEYEEPEHIYEHGMIALGGVIFQALVFIPVITASLTFPGINGGIFNTILFVFGYYNMFIAFINLIPHESLDGYYAKYGLIYLYEKYIRSSK